MKEIKNKYLVFALLIAAVNLVGIYLIFGEGTSAEVQDLMNVMNWLEGHNEPGWYQIYRPLAPMLAMPFTLFADEKTSLLLLTMVFYFLNTYFIFKIVDLIYSNKKQALIASFLYVFSISALRHSLSAHTTEFGSWFFVIFSVYLTLLYLKHNKENILVFTALITGIGMLMKESGGMGVLFFGMAILLSKDFKFKEKILRLVKFGLLFLIPIVFWHLFVYYILIASSHLGFLSIGFTNYPKNSVFERVFYYASQHGLGLLTTIGLLGWLLVIFGAIKEWQEKNRGRIRILVALLPFSFVSLLWPTGDERHAYIVGTFTALLGSYGVIMLGRTIKNKKLAVGLTILVISLYIVLNYSAYYFNDTLPFFDFNDIYHLFTGSLMD